MKKILLAITMFFILTTSLNAVCDYSKQKEYNILASQVSHKIDYVESSKTFNLTIYNLSNGIAIKYNGVRTPINNEVVINNLKEGNILDISIVTTDNECVEKDLRSITVTIPYINTYYNSEECKGHENLNVCSSKFLDYKITKSTFYSLINKKETSTEKTENKKTVEEKETLVEKIIELLTEVYMPIIIVVLSSAVSFLIFSSIYKKAKYGI